MKRNLLISLFLLGAPTVLAQLHTPAGDDAARLSGVPVSATRTERPVGDLRGTVTVVTRNEMERNLQGPAEERQPWARTRA